MFAARRAVRPLGTAAQAASAIAGGRLDTRLENTEDPDLRILTESFNDMAAALEKRVERDARFASDVSHELRSPLMTLAASVEVMEARRDDLPDRARSALDLLSSDVVRFQGLVEDLLEISRFDAGAIRLNMDELLAAEFVRQAVAVSSLPSTPVHVSERAETALIRGDKRRLARVIANLIDNARAYGGGEPGDHDEDRRPRQRTDLAPPDRRRGPRPRRGCQKNATSSSSGSPAAVAQDGAPAVRAPGSGLSLVDEHIRMHGGRVVGRGPPRRRVRRTIRHRDDGDGTRRLMRRLAPALARWCSPFTACSVREDAQPRIIPAEQRTDFDDIATGDEAEGASRIYLLRPVVADEQIQLRSVARNEAISPAELLASLLSGANDGETAARLEHGDPDATSRSTPPGRSASASRSTSTTHSSELSDDGLRQALAQIVATATEIDQVQQVRLRVDGENQGWPTGDGEVTDRPLTIFDYPGFLETSQPDFPALPRLISPIRRRSATRRRRRVRSAPCGSCPRQR